MTNNAQSFNSVHNMLYKHLPSDENFHQSEVYRKNPMLSSAIYESKDKTVSLVQENMNSLNICSDKKTSSSLYNIPKHDPNENLQTKMQKVRKMTISCH